jgi:hypothetical protein
MQVLPCFRIRSLQIQTHFVAELRHGSHFIKNIKSGGKWHSDATQYDLKSNLYNTKFRFIHRFLNQYLNCSHVLVQP